MRKKRVVEIKRKRIMVMKRNKVVVTRKKMVMPKKALVGTVLKKLKLLR
jgi:hypothetical protein